VNRALRRCRYFFCLFSAAPPLSRRNYRLHIAEGLLYKSRAMTEHTESSPPPPLGLRHLTAIQGLKPPQIEALLDLAQYYAELNARPGSIVPPLLKRRTLINLFFENSTRTRSSFEIAGQKLGMDCVNLDIAHSSVKKGETLADTALTLNAMRPSAVVMRHSASGAAEFLTRFLDCPLINAGDGLHAHPTQALLDALTIRQAKGRIAGLTIAICGDILHSRVARSDLFCLGLLGARLRFVAPPSLLPPYWGECGVEIFHAMEDGIKDADVIIMLRLQNERMDGAFIPSAAEYYQLFGLNAARLALARPDCIVMHPGPMNRGVEIASEVADGPRSLIRRQVENGVAARMAVIAALVSEAEARAEAAPAAKAAKAPPQMRRGKTARPAKNKE